jgi:hypothetical protein
MKKLTMAIIVIFFIIPVVCAQNIIEHPDALKGKQISLRANGNTFQVHISEKGVLVILNLEGKLNEKSIEFKLENPTTVIMNSGSGKLSDEEIQLVESSIDAIKSALKRDKFETPGISFKPGTDGKTLQVDIKSGGAVVVLKLEGTIGGNPFEFKSDADGAVVVNSGELSNIEIGLMEFGFNSIKFVLRNAR